LVCKLQLENHFQDPLSKPTASMLKWISGSPSVECYFEASNIDTLIIDATRQTRPYYLSPKYEFDIVPLAGDYNIDICVFLSKSSQYVTECFGRCSNQT
jgi:hypothetical protein